MYFDGQQNTVYNEIVASWFPRVAPIPFNIQKGGTREGVVFIQKERV